MAYYTFNIYIVRTGVYMPLYESC